MASLSEIIQTFNSTSRYLDVLLNILFCYEIDFMASLSEIIQTFNSTSSYLDVLLNIDNPHIEGIGGSNLST